jgi:hypothetical protein
VTGPLTGAARWLAGLALAGAFVVGLMLVYAAPPMQAPDEPFHWQRAVHVSEGGLLGLKFGPNNWGGRIDHRAFKMGWWYADHFAKGQPIGYRASLDAVKEMSDAPRDRRIAPFSSTAVFSPLAYLPQAVGIALARFRGGDLLTQVHAGRLLNLAGYLALLWLAATVIPFGGLVLIALLTGPQALHLAASLSADPLNTIVPVVLMAWCLRLRFDASAPFGRWQRWGLAALALALGLLKPTSFLFSGLILAIPSSRFASARARWVWVAPVILGSFAVAIGWSLAYPFKPGEFWGSGGDPALMIPHILADIPAAARYLLNTIQSWTFIWWSDSYTRFGGHPAPFHIFTDQANARWALIGLAALAVADAAQRRDLPMAMLFATVAASLYLAVLLAFWIAFTPLNAATIGGLQGRYFHAAYALAFIAIALAAPAGRWLGYLRAPLFLAVLALHARALTETIPGFARMWAP